MDKKNDDDDNICVSSLQVSSAASRDLIVRRRAVINMSTTTQCHRINTTQEKLHPRVCVVEISNKQLMIYGWTVGSEPADVSSRLTMPIGDIYVVKG